MAEKLCSACLRTTGTLGLDQAQRFESFHSGQKYTAPATLTYSPMAAMGTTGRDDGWHSGVIFSDIDLIRLNDGRFLSVIREHTTRQSFYAHSRNDGLRWTEIRPTEFKGANIKLFQLRSDNIICTYRNEDPKHRGVSCSVTEDGGETWQHIGQLYVADPTAVHRPSFLCGYPDMVHIGEREITCILHTYADAKGPIDLHFLHLRERI